MLEEELEQEKLLLREQTSMSIFSSSLSALNKTIYLHIKWINVEQMS